MNSSQEAERRAIRKVFSRLVWFLFVLYVCSYLDRINIGYAALAMNKDLGLSATTFGIASTVFYLPYALAEIPSNLVLARVGARRWIARIMITWGVASAATMFANSATSLYVLRALVGLAEAGFVPGMLLYISLWFPVSHRARAMSRFMTAMPATVILAAPLSGAILQLDGAFGLAGWRWLFLLEGIPSVVLGLLVLRFLPDSPQQAPWLTPDDKAALARALARDGAPADRAEGRVLTPAILLFCIAYFCLVTSLNTYATWSPLVMREILGPRTSALTIGLLGAIPAALTIVGMSWAGALSDRRDERLWHTIALFGTVALGWSVLVLAQGPLLKFAGLALASVGAFSAMALFWALVTPLVPPSVRPAGLALISMAGIIGSAVSPSVIGMLRDLFGTFAVGLWYSVALLLAGSLCLLLASARSEHTQVAPGAMPEADRPV